LTIAIFCWGYAKVLLESRTEATISVEANLSSYLIDCVISYFEKLFCFFKAECESILIWTCLEQFSETDLQLEFVDAGFIGQYGDVKVFYRIFFNDRLCQFKGGNVIEFGTFNRAFIARNLFFARHSDKVLVPLVFDLYQEDFLTGLPIYEPMSPKSKFLLSDYEQNGLLKDESAGGLRFVNVSEKIGWLIAVFFVRFIFCEEVFR